MSKKHRPMSGSEDLPLKPIRKRRERAPGPSMADIVNRVIEAKKREEEYKKQQEAEEALKRQQQQQQRQQHQQQQQYTDQEIWYSQQDPFDQQGRYSSDSLRQSPEFKQLRQSIEPMTPEPEMPWSGWQRQRLSPYGDPLPDIESPPSYKENASPTRRRHEGSRENSFDVIEFNSGLKNRTSTPAAATSRGNKDRTKTHVKEKNWERPWQDGKSLAECNKHMLTYEIHCDVTFLIGEEEEAMMAHSYVLMSRSSKLFNLLQKDSSQRNKLYTIPGVTPEIFRDMLTYLYTDEMDLKIQNCSGLLPLADKFGLTVLRTKCFKALMSEMGSETACTILEKAHFYDESNMYSKCMRFILFTGKDVLNANSFKDLCRDCLEKIASSDDLNANEVSVFNGLAHWAKIECSRRKLQPSDENRREVLGNLAFCVRYSQMDVREFTQHISKRDILRSDEKILLYQYFHGEIKSLPNKLYHVKPRRLRQSDRNVEIWNNGQTYPFQEPDCWDPVNNQPLEFPGHVFPSQRPKERTLHRVSRFMGTEGYWAVKNPDAISFRASEAFDLRGIQVYGPIKEACTYEIDITVHDDLKNAIREETKKVTIDQEAVCDVLLSEPVRVPEGRLFTVETRMKGSGPTVRGVSGIRSTIERGITFEFIDSSMSLNGTDVTMGQIPAILFTKS